jgi:hypothetical protein
MKRVFVWTLFFCAFACGLNAQAVDTTVCAVLKSPSSFDGKIVRIKGTVVAGFDEFVLVDTDCGLPVNGIWISYPEGEKVKSGPLAFMQLLPAHNFAGKIAPVTRTPVTLTRDKGFKDFDSLLSKSHTQEQGMCLGCESNEVTATLTGRLDGVDDPSFNIDSDNKIEGLGGFGNMNAYPARLVLESVADVAAVKVDYSTTDKATRSTQFDNQGQANQPLGLIRVDAFAEAEKIANGMGSNPTGLAAQKDMAQFGNPRGSNGVTMANGVVNEASAKEDALGTADSPDGVIYKCTFNSDRLQGDMMALALIHMGQHVTDLRTAKQMTRVLAYSLEYNGWMITTSAAIHNGVKFLVAPGANMMWSSSWPAANVNDNIAAGVKSFLTNQAHLTE